MTIRKVAILLNSSWNIVNFRMGLLKALNAHGHSLIAISPADEHAAQLTGIPCRHVPLDFKSNGINPVQDLRLLWRLFHVLRREKPDVILSYTIKPNIYGSLAARFLGIPVIVNVAGLGTAFTKQGPLQYLVMALFKLALRRSKLVFFQNEEDRRFFVEHQLVDADITARLPGSGVDLYRFQPSEKTPAPPGHLTFIFVARLLREKGIADFVSAAQLIRVKYPGTRFQIVGFTDEHNAACVTKEELAEWVASGAVDYLGRSEDVRVPLSAADCMVLPSYYREGVPKVLLEAAAMALPIITCNTVGCRDVVDDGVNGWLCEPRSPLDLADKMERMILLSPQDRLAMGHQGRLKMERDFSETLVISHYLAAIARTG